MTRVQKQDAERGERATNEGENYATKGEGSVFTEHTANGKGYTSYESADKMGNKVQVQNTERIDKTRTLTQENGTSGCTTLFLDRRAEQSSAKSENGLKNLGVSL